MAHEFLEVLFKQEDQKLRDILQDLNRSSTSLKASVLDQIKTYFYSVLATFQKKTLTKIILSRHKLVQVSSFYGIVCKI